MPHLSAAVSIHIRDGRTYINHALASPNHSVGAAPNGTRDPRVVIQACPPHGIPLGTLGRPGGNLVSEHRHLALRGTIPGGDRGGPFGLGEGLTSSVQVALLDEE